MTNRSDPLKSAQELAYLPIFGSRYLFQRDLPKLLKQFAKGTATLDYGCGPGRSSIFLKSLGLDVEGMDICEHALKLARQLDPDGKYSIIKSANILTDNEVYDVVYAGYLLPHAATKSEMLMILKEITRVLKPNGIFIATQPNENFYRNKWLDIDNDFPQNKNPTSGSLVKIQCKNYDLSTIHHYWTREDYHEVFMKAGLNIVWEHKPLGQDTDGFPWVNEKEIPMITIYVANKCVLANTSSMFEEET